MNNAFVGTRSLESDAALITLLQDCSAVPRYYFLRWVHQVEWTTEIPSANFPSPEGEMITPQFEIRWKKVQQGYDVLLLAVGEPSQIPTAFEPLPFNWEVSEPLAVHLLGQGAEQDMRFPRNLYYPPTLNLQQRYFQDQQTGTVHFVARTLAG
ncbi:MAG: hypothetical protein ACKO24_07170 [Leptolyngbyaceae cyanobacterium]